jgi:hypothetical protein
MGFFLQEHDIYVGSLLDEFNVRFAPGQRHAKSPEMKKTHFGGMEEMVALQKEFKIFKKGRPFMMSVRVLNVGAFNNDVKNRWHEYLESLAKHPSNKAGRNGDQAIVDTLVKNLSSKAPLPVHFDSHDLREDNRVLITDKSRPRHFMDTDFITISLPMKPFDSAGKDGAKAAKAPKSPGKKR